MIMRAEAINYQRLRDIQKRMAREISLKDQLRANQIHLIAGFDLSFTPGSNIICSAILLDYKTLTVLEQQFTVSEEVMPYVPTFLAFREGPPIIETYRKLGMEPDVLMIDGNGILHPYKVGIATHVGISLGKPTIGVAKQLLCGTVKQGKVFVNDELRGLEVTTKEHAKPIYVSPGHLISLTRSVEITRHCLKGHKLPEPLQLAHKFANDIRKEQTKVDVAKQV
ncbi:endonuclease V [Candidatus Woesearchaeota archaeon]|nr:endonuclease V [Candidatus Woesearchaeota archaeon]